MNYIVTIDGPSGVGKTSLGSLLAQEYNSNFFSSGKLYRIIAKYFIDHSTSDTSNLQIEINEELQITLNSYSYSDSDLYIKNTNSKSSEIAKIIEVRQVVSESLCMSGSKNRYNPPCLLPYWQPCATKGEQCQRESTYSVLNGECAPRSTMARREGPRTVQPRRAAR